MEITVTKDQLNKALGLAGSIASKKTTMPILSHVLLSAENGELRIAGSDAELTAVVRIPSKVKSKGSTTVNAKILSDIVRELPEGDVSIKLTEGERVEIVTKTSKLKIVGASAEEYPGLPGIILDPQYEIESLQLLEMINKTIYAVSADESRFNLSGVCVEIINDGKGSRKENTLKMVATDGHRLSFISRPSNGIAFEGRIIAPKKGLLEIRKVLNPEGGSTVKLGIIEGFLIIESTECKIAVQLVDSEYPEYSAVIPKTKGSIAKVSSKDLTQALRRTALMVTDRGKCVKLDFSEGHLRITSSSPELGEAIEELPISYEGKPLSIGFNALYMLDFAASIGDDKNISIELNGELAGAKFSSEGDESYFGIVMPMRL